MHGRHRAQMGCDDVFGRLSIVVWILTLFYSYAVAKWIYHSLQVPKNDQHIQLNTFKHLKDTFYTMFEEFQNHFVLHELKYFQNNYVSYE